jgi:hypothetical protein
VRKTITVKWLKQRRACEEEIRRFQKLFDDSCEITPENILLAGNKGCNMAWVATRTLSRPHWNLLANTKNETLADYYRRIDDTYHGHHGYSTRKRMMAAAWRKQQAILARRLVEILFPKYELPAKRTKK